MSNADFRRAPKIAMIGLLAMSFLVTQAAPGLALGVSTFESDDGNMAFDGQVSKTHDWANFASVDAAADLASGGSDDSFVGGTKQDTVCPGFTTGSIPPNKDDLIRFYVGHEKGTNGDDLLYLAWERTPTTGGSAHMSFEFNESTTPCANSKVNERSEDDMLITYDFEGGNSAPSLGLMRWVTTGSDAQCEAGSVPCWGNRIDLNGALSDGAVNTSASFTDPLAPVAPGDTHSAEMGPNQFGEAAINLTLANVFAAGQCDGFGSATLSSRSSGNSFKAQLKDFIGPAPLTISNCGSVRIIKTDDAGDPLTGATFTLYNNDGTDPNAFDNGDTATSFSCSPTSNNVTGKAECTLTEVPFGPYWVVETTVPAGHDGAAPQAVNVAVNTTVTVTFVNTRKPARVNITKKDDTGAVLAGATFKLFRNDGSDATKHDASDTATSHQCTTGTDGTCSMTNILEFGTFWVVEVITPSGYETAPPQKITLGLDTTVNLNFVNPRLFKVIVLVCQEATNQLYGATVNFGGSDKNTLTTPPTGVSHADLCGINEGQIGGLKTGSKGATVTIS